MRIAHFDCFSGISGDMTLGALIGAGVPVDVIRSGLASLQLPITLEVEEVLRGCFAATYVSVKVPEADQTQRHLSEIQQMIEAGSLTPRARKLALEIFQRIGVAEAAAHGMSIEQVHFHEVGALDSIADIVGSAIGLDWLNIDEYTSSPVPTGHGTIKAAHGVMPIPAPATAALLKGVPLADSPKIKTELTTPTGAAILTTLVKRYLESPVMCIEAIGYGAGTKDFAEHANVLRLFVGTVPDPAQARGYEFDEVWLLETNLDDVPGEAIGYCVEQLLAAGALDAYTTPIQMKKQRPGVMLSVIVEEAQRSVAEHILFRETRTLGIRHTRCQRSKLHRRMHSVLTAWGPVLGKLSWSSQSEPVFTPEYESCVLIARMHHVALLEVYQAAIRQYALEQGKVAGFR